MKAQTRTIVQHLCRRCDYTWWPRKGDVKICPRCKSARWNEQLKQVTVKGAVKS